MFFVALSLLLILVLVRGAVVVVASLLAIVPAATMAVLPVYLLLSSLHFLSISALHHTTRRETFLLASEISATGCWRLTAWLVIISGVSKKNLKNELRARNLLRCRSPLRRMQELQQGSTT